MKTITVRGLDEKLVEKLKQVTKKKAKSVNQFILDTLKREFGMEKKKKFSKTYNDMDHLFGKWTEGEFNQIQNKIDNERKIDAELWE